MTIFILREKFSSNLLAIPFKKIDQIVWVDNVVDCDLSGIKVNGIWVEGDRDRFIHMIKTMGSMEILASNFKV